MAKVSQKSIERRIDQVLRSRLRLRDPEFQFERLANGRVSGNIISDSLKGMKAIDRQRKIWDAFEQEFGPDLTTVIGTFLAYTRAEWDVDLN